MAIKEVFQTNLGKLVAQLPYKGEVTGRDGQNVTVNMGLNRHLKNGDTLIIGTIAEVKIHPLYRTIEGWQLTPSGKAVVDRVDENIAFCKVLKEDSNHPIERYQKITEIKDTVETQPEIRQ